MGKNALNVRKIKKQCDVRNCKNTDCFAISRSRESGKSIIICGECANEIGPAVVEFLESYVEPEKAAPEPLFFSAGVAEEVEITEDDNNDNDDNGSANGDEGGEGKSGTDNGGNNGSEGDTGLNIENNSGEGIENSDTNSEDGNAEGELKCKYCGKVCASKLGLGSHERSCKAKDGE
jgi:hypothetical protein